MADASPGPDAVNYWENRWEAGSTPWNTDRVAPGLLQILDAGLVPEGRCLVPGCGQGWEALELGRRGHRSVLALDIAPTSLNLATKLRDEAGIPPAVVTYENADFFEYNPADKFDFVFDYTFFCAIPPDWRPRWAQGMARVVKPALGQLATLMFPITPLTGNADSGPPFWSPPEAYKEVLEPLGFRIVFEEPVANSLGPRQGKERIAIWRLEA